MKHCMFCQAEMDDFTKRGNKKFCCRNHGGLYHYWLGQGKEFATVNGAIFREMSRLSEQKHNLTSKL